MKKTALVTGGSRGIGLAVSKHLSLDGYDLVVVGRRSKSDCVPALELIRAQGSRVLYIQADVSSSEDRKRIVELSLAEYGRIDVLVNNAGIAPKNRTDLLEMTEDSWDVVLDTNTKATMFLTQLVAKAMISQEKLFMKRGTIINISSCSATVSSISRGEYCVSKAGIAMLTTLFADRLAQEEIFVHEIRPGVILTDMTSTVTQKYDQLIAQGVFPLARWGKSEDVASAV
ncbi:MAG: 3-ketoacyl-ACP reductase, partial [Sphaerochaeta sp.]